MRKISVIMSVYNSSRYLAAAIESIIKQTFSDFEFIIINDGSTDDSLEIIQHYSLSDNRIKVISRENKGLVVSLNEGIENAMGEYIARMDADDISHPTRLMEQIEYLEKHPEVVCIGTGARVIDKKGRYLINKSTVTGSHNVLSSALSGVCPIAHPSAMFLTCVAKKVGGYSIDDYPAEDLSLWLKMSHHGEINNLSSILLDYRIHDESISTQRHSAQLKKTYEICNQECLRRGRTFQFNAIEGRADESKVSQYEITRRHAWWAYKSRQWRTTFIYGLKCIRLNSFKSDGWRIVYCSMFKRR